MPEVIVLEPDPETRMLLRALFERDGYQVTEAEDLRQTQDVVRASTATVLLTTAQVRAQDPRFFAELQRIRPDLDILAPPSMASALVEGGAARDAVGDLARDAVLLLAVLAEDACKRPAAAEKIARLAELTALKLGLGRLLVEATGAAAALVALGPNLVALRFGVADDPGGQGADGGVGRDIQAALAAASALRNPYDLRTLVEHVEERFDGRGRPRGLKGPAIPIVSRVVAVAREFGALSAEGNDEVVATELVRSRAGADYDPKVVDAFFQALRDESYLDRLESGRRGARVLVADPDPAALALCELRLGAAGFRVTTVQDGAAAADLCATDPPDLLLCETTLPKVDGVSLLLKLKRDPKTQALPVIFVSTRTDAGLLNKCLKLGARDVLAKPINFDVLLAKIRTLASATATQQGGGGAVQGDLAEMPLTDFFQVLTLGRKTVKVVVSSPLGQGQVFFERGAPVAAFTQKLRGMDAFAELISWTQGGFSIVPGDVAPERNLDAGLENMLLQVAAVRASLTGSHSGDMGPGVLMGVGQRQGSGGHGSGGHGSSGHGSRGHRPAPVAGVTAFDDDDPYGPAPGAPPAPAPASRTKAPENVEFDFGQSGVHLDPFAGQ